KLSIWNLITSTVHGNKSSGFFDIKKIFKFPKRVLLRHTEKSAKPSIYKGFAVFASKLEIYSLT
ncbi:MAG: hypothetical protein RR366_05155, partial [Clostridium sp.]